MKNFKEVLKGKNGYEFSVSFWLPDGKVKGIVQILHGMVEYIDRYDDFARYLCNLGFAVAGDDHRGHGFTAGEENLGKVPDGHTYFDTVDDAIILTDYLQSKYPDVPTIVFGHSYGSFLAQGYIQQNSDKINGCVLCGSARMDNSDVKMGRKVANMQFKLYGKDKPANLIRKLSFGGYDKPFKHEKRKNAWLNRDVDACEKYNNDKFCNYTMSIGFYKYFFDGLIKIYEQDRLDKINKDLPLFIISGDKDPVGNMGKLVRDLYDLYVDNGIKNVKIKLYNNARHEILNELNKTEVYQDVSDWISSIVLPVKSGAKSDKSEKADNDGAKPSKKSDAQSTAQDEKVKPQKTSATKQKKSNDSKSDGNGTESQTSATKTVKSAAAKSAETKAKSDSSEKSASAEKSKTPASAKPKTTTAKTTAKAKSSTERKTGAGSKTKADGAK